MKKTGDEGWIYAPSEKSPEYKKGVANTGTFIFLFF
jgi:hypothetical protein